MALAFALPSSYVSIITKFSKNVKSKLRNDRNIAHCTKGVCLAVRTIDKINYYLTKENKNGADLCEYLGVSSGVYSQWNTGRTHPRKSKLPIIAEYLGVEVSDIQGNAAVIRDYGKTPAAIRQVPLLSMLKEALQPIRKMPKDTYIIGLDTKPVSKSRYDRICLLYTSPSPRD